ncbi:UDP-N-acetylmuramoylalanyl-D-glutamyl-2, 6- diaminopimelate--D-alanyl-D-alanine ligase [Fructilactobacillus florum 8D]|uniref:UDP-N-acetylmuramoyl-tripeptide--D-alanyl-D-alanine ligase n=3 Tax=Fructilactobacillus florum TaxID=640331 RepID=W9EGP5_9LACO|nr:UDP-N-acetylmuramoyl-tripeptide--D-alanyl-D-alanine ligase [Fructilactobacillus florum]ETO40401.1 UDP-N-acetylmuramoylalanyl-D-glutamyl-2, 6- diaminopimelate--D-alanyl-D-alanine ligase [Fructilactobacillus florum 8D]KRM90027.1 UDP-N-acetylmuramoyl-tripeptide--D-alanyl-D-alani ne ligase [Fructilactobacillus florum DSM 22689 = JCM 16035]
MKMKIEEVAQAVSGELTVPVAASELVTSVDFDSRKLTTGALFVPLTGTHDGHQYLANAIEKGAVAALWSEDHRDTAPADFPVIIVPNPLAALQTLARYYLTKINPKVIAVTGSNGKTTTKDLIASICKTRFNVTKTQGNYNNEIGVPITVLSMDSSTEVLVVEMGMDRPGQLTMLSQLTTPDIAVITMIGEAHIEFFKTRARIADAKMEITSGLRPDSWLIYKGDEPLLQKRASALPFPQKTFGESDVNDLYVTESQTDDQKTVFTTNAWPKLPFTVQLPGRYNVNNALAALAVGDALAIPAPAMQQGLEAAIFTKNRTEWLLGDQGEKILSDVYNSNPTAVRAVLQAFAASQPQGKRIVVLGDMLELGDAAPQLHAKLAEVLDPNQFNSVFLLGTEMQALKTALADKYQLGNNLFYYDGNQQPQLLQELRQHLTSKDEVLLKGSHGMHLEIVLQGLLGEKSAR